MAEMVGSIVVGEVVNRTSSFLIGRHREALSTREGVERLEMAHIKMEAALDVSARWHAADLPLLRWRRKLRRAADECDSALHRWKLRELQEEEAQERLARAPLPRRIAQAVLRFASALLELARGGGGGEASRARAAVRRFERLADGAAEFLRYVEFNSAPRKRRVFGPAVVRELGEGVEYGMLQGGEYGMLQGGEYGMLQGGGGGGGGARHCLLGSAAAQGPAEVWMGSRKRRASGEKLLLV